MSNLCYVLNLKPHKLASATAHCEFLGMCTNESAGETPCCSRRRCVKHLKPEFACRCLLACMEKKRRPVAEGNVPPSADFRCEMTTKPPKPRCQTCKLGLITGVK